MAGHGTPWRLTRTPDAPLSMTENTPPPELAGAFMERVGFEMEKGTSSRLRYLLNLPLRSDMLNEQIKPRKHLAQTSPHWKKCGAFLIRMIQDSLSHTYSTSRRLSMPRGQERKRHPPPQKCANDRVYGSFHTYPGGQLLNPATNLLYLFTIAFEGPFRFHHAKSFASEPVTSSLTNILGPDGPRRVTSPFCIWNE